MREKIVVATTLRTPNHDGILIMCLSSSGSARPIGVRGRGMPTLRSSRARRRHCLGRRAGGQGGLRVGSALPLRQDLAEPISCDCVLLHGGGNASEEKPEPAAAEALGELAQAPLQRRRGAADALEVRVHVEQLKRGEHRVCDVGDGTTGERQTAMSTDATKVHAMQKRHCAIVLLDPVRGRELQRGSAMHWGMRSLEENGEGAGGGCLWQCGRTSAACVERAL